MHCVSSSHACQRPAKVFTHENTFLSLIWKNVLSLSTHCIYYALKADLMEVICIFSQHPRSHCNSVQDKTKNLNKELVSTSNQNGPTSYVVHSVPYSLSILERLVLHSNLNRSGVSKVFARRATCGEMIICGGHPIDVHCSRLTTILAAGRIPFIL